MRFHEYDIGAFALAIGTIASAAAYGGSIDTVITNFASAEPSALSDLHAARLAMPTINPHFLVSMMEDPT